MADNHSPEQRHYNMSQIKGTNSKAEVKVRKFLFSQGFRYRKNVGNLPGKPDIVLTKYKTIIFVHGCFWHKHNCEKFKWPKTNIEYWEKKINNNAIRDTETETALLKMGWHVITIWECMLTNKCFEGAMTELTDYLRKKTQTQNYYICKK